uniref:Uncharacterized protein n=1 Tax=Arundo donax TaxID=35708 RepID=A0A0A9A9S7_ARUDO
MGRPWIPAVGFFAGGGGKLVLPLSMEKLPIVFQWCRCGPARVLSRWLLRLNMRWASPASLVGGSAGHR